jgi:hypothetical protein
MALTQLGRESGVPIGHVSLLIATWEKGKWETPTPREGRQAARAVDEHLMGQSELPR